MGEQAAAKVCAVCGKDVANSPRVKDAQGHYLCRGACEQKAREGAAVATSPARAADAGGMGVMAQLIDQSPMTGATPCGNCGNPMPRGQVVCLRCGFDVRTGRTQRTHVTAEKRPKNEGPVRAPRRAGDFGPSFGVLVLLSIGVFCGLAVLGAFSPAVFIAAYLLCTLAYLGAYVWCVVVAFVTGNGRFGVYGLLCVVPIVQLISLVFLFWSMFGNPDKWSRSLMIGSFLSYLLLTVVLFTTYGGFEGLMKMMGP